MTIAIIIAILIVILDQCIKLIFEMTYNYGQMVDLIPNTLYFTKTYNTGAAWSMLDDSTLLLACISLVVSIILIYLIYLSTKENKQKYNKVYQIALALILGGGVGNMIDRFLTVFKVREGVIDFIGMYIFDYSFPVYNIADMAAVFGVITMGVYILFLYKEKKIIPSSSDDSICQDESSLKPEEQDGVRDAE